MAKELLNKMAYLLFVIICVYSWFKINVMKKVFFILILLTVLLSSELISKSAIELRDTGDEYFNAGKYYEALEQYQKSLKVNRNFREVRLKIGKTYEKIGKDNLALKIYTNSLRLDRNYKPVLIATGDLLLRLEKAGEALKYYESAFRMDPKDINSMIKMTEVYFVLKDYSTSSGFVKNVLKIEPEYNDALLYQGLLEMEKGNLKSAEKYLLRVKDKDFKEYRAFLNLAVLKHKSGNIKDAVQYIKRAIQLEPDNNNVVNTSLRIYIDGKNWEDSVEALNKIIKLKGKETNPENYLNYYNLGVIYLSMKKIDKSIENLKKSTTLNSGDELAKFFLEETLLDHKSYYSEDRIELSDEHIKKSKYYAVENILPLAFAELRQGIKLNGDNYKARSGLGFLFIDSGFLEKGIKQLKIANKLHPADYRISDKLEFLERESKTLLSRRYGIDQYEIDKVKIKILIPDFEDRMYKGHLDAGKTFSFVLNHFFEQSRRVEPVRLENVKSSELSRVKKEADISNLDYYITGRCHDTDDRLIVNVSLFKTRNNKRVYKTEIMRQGNNKLAKIANKIGSEINEKIEFRGRILKLMEDSFVISLGMQEEISTNSRIKIIRNRKKIGEAKISEVDEQISKAVTDEERLLNSLIIGDVVELIKKQKDENKR